MKNNKSNKGTANVNVKSESLYQPLLKLEGALTGERKLKDGSVRYMGRTVDLQSGACALLKQAHPEWSSEQVTQFLRTGKDVQSEIAAVACQRAMENGRIATSLFEYTSGNSAVIRFKNALAGTKSSGPRKVGKREAAALALVEAERIKVKQLEARLSALASQAPAGKGSGLDLQLDLAGKAGK